MSQVAGTPGSSNRALTIPEFWQLAVQSQLMTPPQTQALHQAFVQANGRQPLTVENLVEWLIAQQNLSRFQATVLLARQPGPFIFGDYKLYDRIENGRLAGVFRAVHTATSQPVLLLFLSGPLAQDPTRLADAAQAAAISQGVNHPHVLRAYHFADLQQYRFVVFENVYGQSADELLKAQGPVPAAEACRLIRQAALGLMRLEERQLTHGELRPENVWINHLGTVKLVGFPLSRDPLAGVEPIDINQVANPQSRISRMADYLAPEVSRSGQPGDIRADIYSLGCVFYELLTGRKPFADQTTMQKVLRHASEAPVPPHVVNPQVPLAVSQLVLYLLAKDPGQRYQKPAHVSEALVPYIDPRGLTTFAEPPTPPGQAYEAWLAQRYPGAEPDPGTGEFKYQFQAADFAGAKNTTAAAVNFSGVGFASAPGAPAPQPGGFAPAAGAAAEPAPLFRTDAPAKKPGAAPSPAAAAGKAAAPAAPEKPKLSPAEEQRLADEKFQKQLVTYSIAGGGLVVVLLIGLIIFNRMNRPSDSDVVASTSEVTAQATHLAVKPATTTLGTAVASNDPRPGVNPGEAVTPGAGAPTAPASADAELAAMYEEKGPLWASPLTGPVQPVSLAHLPLESSMFVSLRPSELLANPEGKKVWEALGGWGKLARATIEERVGAPLEDIEHVVISFSTPEGVDKFPDTAYVAKLVRPMTPDDLLAKWGAPEEVTVDGKKAYKSGDVAWYLPRSGGGQVVASCPAKRLDEIVAEDGGPSFATPQMDALYKQLDSRAHVAMLLMPNFLFSGGKSMFTGSLAHLVRPGSFLHAITRGGNNQPAKAASVTLHIGPEYFYTEARLHPGPDMKPIVASTHELYESLTTIPELVYDYYKPPVSAEANFGFIPTEHSIKVLARYPKMLEAWASYLRAGVEDGASVFVSASKIEGAHNLALGTQLALRDPGVKVERAKPVNSVAAMSLEEKLKNVKTNMVFGREALGRVIDQFAKEQEIAIEISGNDLQLDGITQNQSFGMNLTEKVPLEVVLQEIVKQANPGNPSKKLDVPEQKLLYVISPDKKKVIITTRAKAFERGTPAEVFKVEKK